MHPKDEFSLALEELQNQDRAAFRERISQLIQDMSPEGLGSSPFGSRVPEHQRAVEALLEDGEEETAWLLSCLGFPPYGWETMTKIRAETTHAFFLALRGELEEAKRILTAIQARDRIVMKNCEIRLEALLEALGRAEVPVLELMIHTMDLDAGTSRRAVFRRYDLYRKGLERISRYGLSGPISIVKERIQDLESRYSFTIANKAGLCLRCLSENIQVEVDPERILFQVVRCLDCKEILRDREAPPYRFECEEPEC